MSENVTVFYMKTSGKEVRIYIKTDRTRSIKAAVVTDAAAGNRCGGISRPRKTPLLDKGLAIV